MAGLHAKYGWEPSFCSLDRLSGISGGNVEELGTFIL